MRAKVLSHDLKEAVSWVKPGEPRVGTTFLPVLKNVLVECSNHGVRLTLTDLTLGVTAVAGAKVTRVGATTVPFKKFERTVKSLPDGEIVRLATERKYKGKGESRQLVDETCTLTCGSLSLAFKTIVADEFPVLVHPVRGTTFNEASELPELCRTIDHAIASDDSRVGLTFAQLLKGKLVAADGFRLAAIPVPHIEDERPIFIHRQMAQFLVRQKQPLTKLVVDFKHLQLAAFFGDNVATCRMYDGHYPDWEQIVPTSHAWEIRVPYGSLKDAAQLFKQLAPAAKIVRFEYQRSQLSLTGSEGETFEMKQTMKALHEGQTEVVFALNIEYVLDDLKARRLDDSDWIILQGNSPSSPVAITDAHTQLYEMIMPMHIGR